MNWVKKNRQVLEIDNYVLKADTTSNYWFGVSQQKLDDYRLKYNTEFHIILFGSDDNEGDFYTIPFLAIQDLLIEENLYSFDGRKRWVGDIRNHILRIRNTQIERNISDFFSLPQTSSKKIILQKDNLNDYAIENAKREIMQRTRQSDFRKNVLKNFQGKCCLTGVTENHLLVASHIIPWASKIETRLSPHNGLCLSVLYDNLFDKGFFTFNDNYEVVVTTKLSQLSHQTHDWLCTVSKKVIATPTKFEISKTALAHHRNFIFDKF